MKRIADHYTFPKAFWHIAQNIGKYRHKFNTSTRANNRTYDAGNQNIEIDFYGVLGELIAHEFLLNNTKDYSFILSPLLSDKPAIEPDLIIQMSTGKRFIIDIKYSVGLQPQINAKNKEKNIDGYWIVKIMNNKKYQADIYQVSAKTVYSTWPLKTMENGSQYYECPKRIWPTQKN